jgi:hypothetical protein
LDERSRRLSHEELGVALQLRLEGHDVRSVPETGAGRTSDLEVCGVLVEVKSWLRLGAGRDRAPTPRSVVNKLLKADGQAATVVLNGRGSGLTADVARAGMVEHAARVGNGQVQAVRVLGDDFDLSWTRRRAIRRSAGVHPRTAEVPDIAISV